MLHSIGYAHNSCALKFSTKCPAIVFWTSDLSSTRCSVRLREALAKGHALLLTWFLFPIGVVLAGRCYCRDLLKARMRPRHAALLLAVTGASEAQLLQRILRSAYIW